MRSFEMTLSVYQCARPAVSEDFNLQLRQSEVSHQAPRIHYTHSKVEACHRKVIIVLHK
jgi:hypothetical protein